MPRVGRSYFQRRRPAGATSSGPPPPPPASYPTRFYTYLATARGNAQFPGGSTAIANAARQAIVRAVGGRVIVQIYGVGGNVGGGMTLVSGTTYAPTWSVNQAYSAIDGLASWRLRIADAVACAGATGTITIVADAPPKAMLVDWNGNPYTTGNDGARPNFHCDPRFYSSTAAGNPSTLSPKNSWPGLIVYLINDMITTTGFPASRIRVVPGQENRGYFRSSLGRIDYVEMTAHYDAVRAGVKAYNPAIKVGGPYHTTQAGLDSGYHTGGQFEGSVQATATVNGPFGTGAGSSVNSTKQVLGVGWHINGQMLDAALYWAAHCSGWDFGVADMWMEQSNTSTTQGNPHMKPATPWPAGTPNTTDAGFDGSIVFVDDDKPEVFGNWWRTHIDPTGELELIEAYPGGKYTTDELDRFYKSAQRGKITGVGIWLGATVGVGSYLWDQTTNVRTPVGDYAAAVAALTG